MDKNRKRNRNRISRIPLKERIQKIKNQKPDFLGIFNVYVGDYYVGLAYLDENSDYFRDIYFERIRSIEKAVESVLTIPEFFDILLEDDIDLSRGAEKEREKILYQTLVEPFIKIKNFEKE